MLFVGTEPINGVELVQPLLNRVNEMSIAWTGNQLDVLVVAEQEELIIVKENDISLGSGKEKKGEEYFFQKIVAVFEI